MVTVKHDFYRGSSDAAPLNSFGLARLLRALARRQVWGRYLSHSLPYEPDCCPMNRQAAYFSYRLQIQQHPRRACAGLLTNMAYRGIATARAFR